MALRKRGGFADTVLHLREHFRAVQKAYCRIRVDVKVGCHSNIGDLKHILYNSNLISLSSFTDLAGSDCACWRL